jgi:hypothetical protein
MVLLSEMICRVVKNLLRERLRERMRALRTMAEEPYKEVRTLSLRTEGLFLSGSDDVLSSQVILQLFNLLLGDPVAEADRWWTYEIKTEISKYVVPLPCLRHTCSCAQAHNNHTTRTCSRLNPRHHQAIQARTHGRGT